jgi:hypothetical protein
MSRGRRSNITQTIPTKHRRQALKQKETNRRLDRAMPEALVLNLHDMMITRTAAILSLSQGPEADDYYGHHHHRPGLHEPRGIASKYSWCQGFSSPTRFAWSISTSLHGFAT